VKRAIVQLSGLSVMSCDIRRPRSSEGPSALMTRPRR
jgi:hypothetical protein